MPDLDLIKEFIGKVKYDLIRSQKEKGIVASGKSAKLLRAEFPDENTGLLIDGSGSFYYQEFGRAKGKMPPYQAIYDWLEYKKYGFTYKDDKERKSLTWMIMSSIRKKGTYAHYKHKPTNVVRDALSSERIQELKKKIAARFLSEVRSDIITDFNKLI